MHGRFGVATSGDGCANPLSARDQLSNPYESPKTQPETTPFFTRRRVFWFGIASIVAALMAVTGSHTLFVEWRFYGGAWDTLVFIFDCTAGIAVLAGIIALTVCGVLQPQT